MVSAPIFVSWWGLKILPLFQTPLPPWKSLSLLITEAPAHLPMKPSRLRPPTKPSASALPKSVTSLPKMKVWQTNLGQSQLLVFLIKDFAVINCCKNAESAVIYPKKAPTSINLTSRCFYCTKKVFCLWYDWTILLIRCCKYGWDCDPTSVYVHLLFIFWKKITF